MSFVLKYFQDGGIVWSLGIAECTLAHLIGIFWSLGIPECTLTQSIQIWVCVCEDDIMAMI